MLLMILYGLLLATPAQAYLDPNSQSLLAQVLTPVPVIGAIAVTFLRKQAGLAIGWLADLIRRPKK
jgi:hypothetical protein